MMSRFEMVKDKDNNSRVIKKYGSRRLYDTKHSKYISFAELGDIIAAGFEITVLEAKTSEDVTRATIASYLIENKSILDCLSTEMLIRLIQAQNYQIEQRNLITTYLDQSFGIFLKSMTPYLPTGAEDK